MPCPFQKYKNALGEPNKGVHSIRILNTPIIDYLLAISLAGLFTFLTNVPLTITTIIVLILGIILHILFGVEDRVSKFFGIKCNN